MSCAVADRCHALCRLPALLWAATTCGHLLLYMVTVFAGKPCQCGSFRASVFLHIVSCLRVRQPAQEMMRIVTPPGPVFTAWAIASHIVLFEEDEGMVKNRDCGPESRFRVSKCWRDFCSVRFEPNFDVCGGMYDACTLSYPAVLSFRVPSARLPTWALARRRGFAVNSAGQKPGGRAEARPKPRPTFTVTSICVSPDIFLNH